jgi:hypothetical protein
MAAGNFLPALFEAYIGEFTITKQADGSVLLNWTTISEHNNDFFELEYSTNGIEFSSIGKVMSKGYTADGFAYQFSHTKPKTGKNYYQFRMVDIAGKSKFSPVRVMLVKEEGDYLSLFPNPAKNNVTLLLDAPEGEKINVEFYNTSGHPVHLQKGVLNNQKAGLALDALKAGIYLVIAVNTKGERFRNKLVIIK